MFRTVRRYSRLYLVSVFCLVLASCWPLDFWWSGVSTDGWCNNASTDTKSDGNTYVLVHAHMSQPVTAATFRIEDLSGNLLWQKSAINPEGLYILNLGETCLPTSFRILLTDAEHAGVPFDGDLEVVVRDYASYVVYTLNVPTTLISRHQKNNPGQDPATLIAQVKGHLGLPDWYRVDLDPVASDYHFSHSLFLGVIAQHGSYESLVSYLLEEIAQGTEPAYSFANKQPRSVTETYYPPDHANPAASAVTVPVGAENSIIDRGKIDDLAKRVAGLAPGAVGKLAQYAWDLGGGFVLDALGLDRSPNVLGEIAQELKELENELSTMSTEIRETVVFEALKTRYVGKVDALQKTVDDTDTIWKTYNTLITCLGQANRVTGPDGQVQLADNPDKGIVVSDVIANIESFVTSMRNASEDRYPLGLFTDLHGFLVTSPSADPVDRPALYLSDAVRLREGQYFDSANAQSIYAFYNYYLARMLKLYVIAAEVANYESDRITSTDISLNQNLVAVFPDTVNAEIDYGYFPDPDCALQLDYAADPGKTGYMWLVDIGQSLNLQWESLTEVLDHFSIDGCHADFGEVCQECEGGSVPCYLYPGCLPYDIKPCTAVPILTAPPDSSWVCSHAVAAHPFSAGGHTDWRLPGKGGYQVVFDILPSTNVVQFLKGQGLIGWDKIDWSNWSTHSGDVFWIEDYRTWTVTNLRSDCDKPYWYDCTASAVKNRFGATSWPWPQELLYYGILHAFTWFPDTSGPTREDKKWIGRVDDAGEPTTRVVDPLLLGVNLCADSWPSGDGYLVYTCHTLANHLASEYIWQGFMVWPVRKVDLTDTTQQAAKGYERYRYTYSLP